MTRWTRLRRISPRLSGFDYRRPGRYFVTFATHDRQQVLAQSASGRLLTTALGEIAVAEWEATFLLRPYVIRDVFVVMPDHVHLLFGIADVAESAGDQNDSACREDVHVLPTSGIQPSNRVQPAKGSASLPGSVPAIVGAYKAAAVRKARRRGLWHDGPLWQARFHDRIVRGPQEAERIRRYIEENPARWLDRCTGRTE